MADVTVPLPPRPCSGDPCRRCGGKIDLPALSRVTDTWVCDACGADEADRDRLALPPIGPGQWPVEALLCLRTPAWSHRQVVAMHPADAALALWARRRP